MGWWILGGVAALILFLWIANRIGLIDLSDKSRRGPSGGGGLMQIGDEIFAPARHEAQVELDRQSRMPAPAPIPGDGYAAIELGATVSIALDEFGRPVYDGAASHDPRPVNSAPVNSAPVNSAPVNSAPVSSAPDAPRSRA